MKLRGYWTKNRCHEEAKKYIEKKDFREKSPSAYSTSIKNKWTCDICSHMNKSNNNSKRCIYVYEFSDNHAYIGLTNNLKRRKRDHTKFGSVFNHIQKSKLIPTLIQLTLFLEVEVAKIQEENYVINYKNDDWIILNKTKTGSIGSNIVKWSKEKCHEKSLKHNYRTDFQKNNSSAYQSAQKNKWLDDICSHMKKKKYKHKKYWTNEKIKEEAKKYKSRNKFKINSNGAYKIALKNKLMDDICSHMISLMKPKGYWTKEKCVEEVKKYNSKTEFKKKSRSSYNAAYKNNWLNEIYNFKL